MEASFPKRLIQLLGEYSHMGFLHNRDVMAWYFVDSHPSPGHGTPSAGGVLSIPGAAWVNRAK